MDADGNHAPMSGSHAHSHPAFGSQGDDGNHAHDHAPRQRRRATTTPTLMDGDGEQDGTQDHAAARVVAVTTAGRILGIESMPLADKALAVHHTASTDEAWDGPAAVAAMPADDTVLKYCHAWEDSDAASRPAPRGRRRRRRPEGQLQVPAPQDERRPGEPRRLPERARPAVRPRTSRPVTTPGVKAHLQAHLNDGGSDAEDHEHQDISGIDLEALRSALKGAHA